MKNLKVYLPKNLNDKNVDIQNTIEFKEYLEYPLVKGLNLTKVEITRNISDIIRMVDEDKGCNAIEGSCINKTRHHITLVRDGAGNLFVASVPCRKMQQHNKVRDNYLDRTFADRMLELRMTPKHLGRAASPSKATLYKTLIEMANKTPTRGLYIYGESGIGKTYSMIAFANELAERNLKIAFVFIPELNRELISTFKNDNVTTDAYTESLVQADVLFLDDFGANESSLWLYNDVITNILDKRNQAAKPTFFTSNYSIATLEKIMNKKNEMQNVRRLLTRVRTAIGQKDPANVITEVEIK